jgi:murein DD-endopeptidase MepM/ murein hydrolase activator NlpD
MARTGINPDQFMRRVAAKEGMGGPEIPLDSMAIDGITDASFQQAYTGASVVLGQLNQLLASIRHIPLTTPVNGSAFERSSGFGSRFDPFSGRPAFHSGLDFSGPWGAQIAVTAPGTVVFAGNSGAYGNMVEVDHGFGIHTRYGHLSSIKVSVGTKLEKGAIVGKLGSTGRSTGPHVHYEVWYDDVVRNPSKFIEAGQHVF